MEAIVFVSLVVTVVLIALYFSEYVEKHLQVTLQKKRRLHQQTRRRDLLVKLCRAMELRCFLENGVFHVIEFWIDGKRESMRTDLASSLILEFCITRGLLFSQIVETGLDLRPTIMWYLFKSFRIVNTLSNT